MTKKQTENIYPVTERNMSFSDCRILCIDDDVHTLNWIITVLKSSQITAKITTANTGRQAFTLINRENFDLWILDYALPDMSGVQLCGLLRQMGLEVPIMFFSAMDRPVDVERARSAGANEYLIKPNDLDMFASTVAVLLRKHQNSHSQYVEPTTRLAA